MLDTPVLVLTGGPCGGKDSVISALIAHFTDLGYVVDVIPETATDLMASGVTPWGVGNEEFQRRVLIEQLRREDEVQERMRHIRGKKLIIANRATMDGLAYIEPEKMFAIWRELGETIVSLRDKRYVGVIHLVTVAIGRPDLFSNATNPTRYERSAEEAAALDHRTLYAWTGCPHLARVDNSTDFEGKVARVIIRAEQFLGSYEHERKWRLLIPFDESLLPPGAQRIEIKQSWVKLPSWKRPRRIRMRGQHGAHIHIMTKKRSISAVSCHEKEKLLDPARYDYLHRTYRLEEFPELVKDRWCFIENNQHWELDVYRDWKHDVILEAELPHPDWPLILPPSLEGNVIEVTGHPGYTSKSISKKMRMFGATT